MRVPVDDVKLWFGIITLMVVEIGLITPPVGLNVFVINSLARDVPMIQTFGAHYLKTFRVVTAKVNAGPIIKAA